MDVKKVAIVGGHWHKALPGFKDRDVTDQGQAEPADDALADQQ
jgi:hypothetical protein